MNRRNHLLYDHSQAFFILPKKVVSFVMLPSPITMPLDFMVLNSIRASKGYLDMDHLSLSTKYFHVMSSSSMLLLLLLTALAILTLLLEELSAAVPRPRVLTRGKRIFGRSRFATLNCRILKANLTLDDLDITLSEHGIVLCALQENVVMDFSIHIPRTVKYIGMG